jgi:hypothetical protein
MALLNQIAPCKRQAANAKDKIAHLRAEERKESRMARAEEQRIQDMDDKAARKATEAKAYGYIQAAEDGILGEL